MASFKEKLSKLNIDDVIFDIMNDNAVKQEIVSLNQQQLLEFGEDVEGNKLRTYLAQPGQVYAYSTIQYKKDKGQPYDHVTLYNTGAFHRSFKAETERSYTQVKGKTKTSDGDISDNLDISKILGLTKESKEELIQFLRVPSRKAFRKALNG